MTALVWKQPPPSTRTDWAAIDAQLRERPGEWALVATRDTEQKAGQLMSELRVGKSQGYGKQRTVRLEVGAFEVERRGLDVYARFVGAA